MKVRKIDVFFIILTVFINLLLALCAKKGIN